MTTDTPATPHHRTEAGTAPLPPYGARPRPWGPRGRHRRPPRPRKLLLGAGGLALAAGALSLVRIVSDPAGGGSGTMHAPRPDRITDPAAGTVPGQATRSAPGTALPGPSATSAMGGRHGATAMDGTPAPPPDTPGPGTGTGSTTIPHRPDTPGTPHASGAPGGPDAGRSAGPRPPRPRTPAPHPTSPAPPVPSRTTPTTPTAPPAPPAPEPEPEPERPGLCIPVIGLCVDLLDAGD
ncbi:hypothetical protein [Streptomyces cyaneogriseus]|uniref:hypothetical protein n=1 Tax=Streptomyces cyaneogriseus TaxID=68192 RepID=UPI00069ADAA0|nr:hypothetical protein [Streptomyces cyaneogriseus]